MDAETFKSGCDAVADFIINYNKNVEEYDVMPNVDPGYLRPLLPHDAPENGENMDQILEDIHEHILKGTCHWAHPHFYAYFPGGAGYPSILGDMLSTGLGCLGFSWASCPALTELEFFVLDMFGKLLHIPDQLLYKPSDRRGGGFMQNSASEGIYNCMLAARTRELKRIIKDQGGTYFDHMKNLVCYASEQAHSCVEKAALLQMVTIRLIKPDTEGDSMRGKDLEDQIESDIAAGLNPFFISACIGTTGTAAIDNVLEITKVVEKYPHIWYHIDGAYGGNALMLPEFGYLLDGIQNIDSMNVNPYKWSLMALDGACLWIRDRRSFQAPFILEPKYYQHIERTGLDLNQHGFSFSHRFRCLKLWFTLRSYGKRALQGYIRNHISLAHRVMNYVNEDRRFKLMAKVNFGLVCFRLRHKSGDRDFDAVTTEFLGRLNHSGKVHLVPTTVRGHVAIRMSINYEFATRQIVDEAWDFIKKTATELVSETDVRYNRMTLRDAHVFDEETSIKLIKAGMRTLDFDNVIVDIHARNSVDNHSESEEEIEESE